MILYEFFFNCVKSCSSADEFLKTFIIPIHIPGHWLLCMIDPVNKTYHIIDCMLHNNSQLTENIRKWYKSEMQRLNYDVSHESDYDMPPLNHSNIASTGEPCHSPSIYQEKFALFDVF